MNATDVFVGVSVILLLVWSAFLQLSLANLSNTVSNIAALQAKQQPLLSPRELCKEKQGLRLVEEQGLVIEEYVVTAGRANNQVFFCFYKKTS